MLIVSQYNKYACFAACLESFLRDVGRDFDHEKFVKANLDLFCGGEKEEGSCNSLNISKVAERLGLLHEHIHDDFTPDHSREGYFLFTFWGDNPRDKHCLRFSEAKDPNTLVAMNPLKLDSLDTFPTSWVREVHKLSLLPAEQDHRSQP